MPLLPRLLEHAIASSLISSNLIAYNNVVFCEKVTA